MIHMFQRHRGRDRVDLEPLLPYQDPQPNRGPHHGIDEQNHQHRMQQQEPVRWREGRRLMDTGQSGKQGFRHGSCHGSDPTESQVNRTAGAASQHGHHGGSCTPRTATQPPEPLAHTCFQKRPLLDSNQRPAA